MNDVTPLGAAWRKSSRSNGQTNCVELSHSLGAVRDSKNPSNTLPVSLAAFVAAAQSGRLDNAR